MNSYRIEANAMHSYSDLKPHTKAQTPLTFKSAFKLKNSKFCFRPFDLSRYCPQWSGVLQLSWLHSFGGFRKKQLLKCLPPYIDVLKNTEKNCPECKSKRFQLQMKNLRFKVMSWIFHVRPYSLNFSCVSDRIRFVVSKGTSFKIFVSI